jgi:hypothetical protein
MSNRFWHTGPAMVFGVLGVPGNTLVQNALTPNNWLASATLLGTCERYPQIQHQVIREEVRNDLGGDNPIAHPTHGQKVTIQCELNRWSQVNVDNVIANFQGGQAARNGLHVVNYLSTFPDIAGNSCGLLIYYSDPVNRPEEGLFLPMASLEEHAPVKVGNRTAAISLRFKSNTGFVQINSVWHSFDYVKYPNNTGLDTALANRLTT